MKIPFTQSLRVFIIKRQENTNVDNWKKFQIFYLPFEKIFVNVPAY